MSTLWPKVEIRYIGEVPTDEYYAKGHRTCRGCGPALCMRYIALAAGPRTIQFNATGCMYVANTSYWTTPWVYPWMHTQLGAFGSTGTGTAAALKALMRKGKIKKEEINVVSCAGDGGGADIGFGPLSGAFDMGYDALWVIYDNESYANTGIQASSLTPWGAWTTFTPPGKMLRLGNVRYKKDVARIAAAHQIPYVATACPSYPYDFMTKIRKGLAAKGPGFVHILAPCPKGWLFPASQLIEVGKRAVESGIWVLYEVEAGKFKITYKPKKKIPVKDYIRMQGRFKHLRDMDIRYIQERTDTAAEEIGLWK
ncbi:MAG: thiamine pyrophosphate-dependent enzyme [Candidatus Bathyarchaeia archaeon]